MFFNLELQNKLIKYESTIETLKSSKDYLPYLHTQKATEGCAPTGWGSESIKRKIDVRSRKHGTQHRREAKGRHKLSAIQQTQGATSPCRNRKMEGSRRGVSRGKIKLTAHSMYLTKQNRILRGASQFCEECGKI